MGNQIDGRHLHLLNSQSDGISTPGEVKGKQRQPRTREKRQKTGHADTPQTVSVHFVHSCPLPKVWAARNDELNKLLHEIRSRQHQVIVITAMGGTGKSTLARKMLEEVLQSRMELDACLWFSFYAESDVDLFFAEACSYFIPSFDPREYPRPFAKSRMLREVLAQKKCLLVLDGLETMLETDQKNPRYGACKDRVLRDFLLGMGSQQEPSQIVITSRCPLTELSNLERYRELRLADFTPQVARNYLLSLGVTGPQSAIDAVCSQYGYHALTLYVLADYLSQAPYYGNIRGVENLNEIPLETPQAAKLNSILEGYWQKLTIPEQFFMTRLAAFRDSASQEASVLLTVDDSGNRCHVDHSVAHHTVRRLLQSSLLEIEKRGTKAFYTAHPLIKSYFYHRLREEERETIHLEIKLYAAGMPIPENPRSLDELHWWLESYFQSIKIHLYDDAHTILREQQMHSRIIWWGHYLLLTEVLQPLLDAYDAGQWSPSPTVISRVMGDMAICLSKAGDPERALYYHQRAAEVAHGDLIQQSEEWQYLSELLAEMGRFSEALQTLEHAQRIESTLQRPAQVYLIMGRQGYYHAGLGKIQEAEEQLGRAIVASEIERGYEGPVYHCLYLRIRGDLAVYLGKLPQAQYDYECALAIARDPSKDLKDYEGHILRGIGDCFRIQGDYERAADMYQQALSLAKNIGYIWLEAEIETSLALLALTKTDYAEAANHAQSVLTLIEKSGWLVQQMLAHLVLAKVAWSKLNRSETKKHLERISPLLDRSKHFWIRQQVEDLTNEMSRTC